MDFAESNSDESVQQLKRVTAFRRRGNCRREDERGRRQRVLDGKDVVTME